MRYITALIVVLLLAGCAAIKSPIDEGYQFGDTTRSLLDIQKAYCTETDTVTRAALLTAIRVYAPTYPLTGACTNPLRIYEFVAPNVVIPDEVVTPGEVQNEIAG